MASIIPAWAAPGHEHFSASDVMLI
ncbi:hypothetical protein RS9916_28429 [Synechococcus sp. RS9916]|nr:hypothetical protein RS9916_28429 [Synechococcus sp. RS9916]